MILCSFGNHSICYHHNEDLTLALLEFQDCKLRGHPTKMNVENENIDPVINVGLALGYSNHSIQRRLSNDLGAGANAASRIDMTFVATD